MYCHNRVGAVRRHGPIHEPAEPCVNCVMVNLQVSGRLQKHCKQSNEEMSEPGFSMQSVGVYLDQHYRFCVNNHVPHTWTVAPDASHGTLQKTCIQEEVFWQGGDTRNRGAETLHPEKDQTFTNTSRNTLINETRSYT